MYPQFIHEEKIEHLQGYLYVQQVMANCHVGQDAIYEYSIYEIPESEQKQGAVETFIYLFLKKIYPKNEIKEETYNFFLQNILLVEIPDWEQNIIPKLDKWFIDKYYSKDVIYDILEYKAKTGTTFEMGDYTYLIDSKLRDLTLSQLRKPNICSFIELVRAVGNYKFQAYEIIMLDKMKHDKLYPSRIIDSCWGMKFNFFIFKNENKFVFLHLGWVLC